MRTEIELKAAAFDSFMEAAKAGGGGVRWPEIQTAAITLSAIYAAEKHRDKKSNSYDDKTEYFGEDYK